MVRIFFDKHGSGEYVIETTAIDVDTFISELSEALSTVSNSFGDDGGLAMMGVLKNAMPIAFKLAGYKADTVSEQRTLLCGVLSPSACEVIASAGR